MRWLSRARWIALCACCALVAGCTVPRAPLPPPPEHPNGAALWTIVHDQCVPDETAHGRPDPCAKVSLGEGEARGYAVLKDRRGASQYLLMPTSHISGIEDPQLLAPGAVDYFAPAWGVRALVEDRLGVKLPREDIGIAVNSLYGRSQDLLHLHVDCLRADVRDALARDLPAISGRWSKRRFDLAGHGYRAIRVSGADAPDADPFRLLAHGLHVPPADMGAWTLVLAGARFPGGAPGFVLLAARTDPAKGYDGSGEALQDHDCAVAKVGTAP